MEPIHKKRIIVFLSFAFGISWLTGLVIYLTGGMINSPIIIEGTSITLAYVLLASAYMWGPAIANVLTRFITKEGKNDLYLSLDLRNNWQYILSAWVGTPLLVLLGTALFFGLFPSYFDADFSLLTEQITLAGTDLGGFSIQQIILIQVLSAILLSPIYNLISTFGEEFGWRAYLLPKLLPLGKRKAIILQGIIWGIWHCPVILMGYNYGFDYFGAPWLGSLAMVWFTLLLGVFLAWLTLKSKSVWAANIAHGALNGFASIGALFLTKDPPLLLGPYPTGVVGSIPFLILAIVLLLFMARKKKSQPVATVN